MDANRTSRISLSILLVGFPLSLICEYLQIPRFHVEFLNTLINSRVPLSILSTLLDIFGVYAIYFMMMKLFGKSWTAHWNILKMLVVIISGIVLVVVGERLALAIGVWSYSVAMPVIPVLGIGLTPFLIFAFVPLIIIYVASRLS